MHRRLIVAAIAACLSITPALADNWPQWRGPFLNGISSEKNLPTRWSTEENVTWKIAMPSWISTRGWQTNVRKDMPFSFIW